MGALLKLSDVIKSTIIMLKHIAPLKGTVQVIGLKLVGWNDWRVAMLA